MHPGPMNRGVEIAAEVADSVRSTIVEQVTNGVSVRMAVLYLLLGGAADGRSAVAASQAGPSRPARGGRGGAGTWLITRRPAAAAASRPTS